VYNTVGAAFGALQDAELLDYRSKTTPIDGM
jgi:hypothetical protein